MTRKEQIQIAVIAEKVDQIHDILKGDEGLCKRVNVLEKAYVRVTGIAAGVGFICSLLWTAISHVWSRK